MVSWLYELELWQTDYLAHRAGAAPESHIRPSLPTLGSVSEQPHQAFPMNLRELWVQTCPCAKMCLLREIPSFYSESGCKRDVAEFSTDLASVTSAHALWLLSDTAPPLCLTTLE